MSLRFKRQKENFCCEHCRAVVVGNGFTNHCPHCLYSKHVDVYPGDRQGICLALMEPVSVSLVRGKYVITHHCTGCGIEKRNRANADDELNLLLDRH